MNSRAYTDDDADYARRLYDAVINAVVTLDGDGTGVGGFVRPDIVRMTLAEVTATIDFNADLVKVVRDRRRLGEDLAARYVLIHKSLSDGATGPWPKASRADN